MPSDKNIRIAALAVFVVMALVAAVPFWLDRSTTAVVRQLRAELEQQQRLDGILDSLRDAENAERGFVITGNEALLQPYYQARQALPAALRDARGKAASDAERAGVWRITRLAELKLAELDETVAMRRMNGLAKTGDAVNAMSGKPYMDELRRLIGVRQARAEVRREELRTEMLAASRRSFIVSFGATLINVCVFGALLMVLARMLRERQNNSRQLEQRAEQLAVAVEQGGRHNRELKAVAEMLRAVEALPSSLDTGPVVARSFARLLPGTGGAFFALGGDGAALRQLSRWGEASVQPAEIALDDCQAPRTTSAGGAAMLLRIPLLTHDELVGMIHLEGLSREPGVREEQERLAASVAEQLALALGNARLRESLRRQSILDPLTGLFNRRCFDETLKRELARSRRTAVPLSLVVLDVDHFKRVNDSFGHATGDAVLRAIAQLVRQSIRDCDFACRYGGEELVILMPDCSQQDAVRRAEALRAGLAAAPPMLDDAGPSSMTASFGVAEYPIHGPDAEALFQAADKALYQAKREGRNRVVVAAQA